MIDDDDPGDVTRSMWITGALVLVVFVAGGIFLARVLLDAQ